MKLVENMNRLTAFLLVIFSHLNF